MDVISRKVIRSTSRRNALKLGAAFAVTATPGLPKGLRAQAARPKAVLLTVTGSVARLTAVLADQLKLYDKYQVDVETIAVSDSGKILNAMVSGDGDMCPGSGFNQLFPAMEKGAKIKILAGASVAPSAILYTCRPDIKSVKDLEGRTVGTDQPGALLNQLATATMKKYGVDYRKVNFVNVGGSPDIFKALVAKTIDAGAAPIEFRDTAGKYGLTALPDGEFWKELPLYVNQTIYASEKAIAERREGLIRVMAAYEDMFLWIQNPANRSDFMRYYKMAMTSASDDEAAFFYVFLSKPGALAPNLEITEKQLQFVQELNVEFQVQKAVLPFAQVADTSLAKEAVKRVKSS